uniref:hypothetical protein n=1 Tax=Algoriphagus sp. TaxID=1872435 RepID=UPI0040486860
MYLHINGSRLFEAFAENNGVLVKKLIPANFKLITILLHDPKSDPEFDRLVGSNFSRWTLNSVKDFYFTALPDPPQSWFRWSAEEEEKIFKQNPYLSISNQRVSNSQPLDPSIKALFLAEYFGIPFRKLPAFIFTTDTNLTQFYWMPANKKELNEQYTWLQSVSTNSTLIFSSKEYHRYKVREINLPYFFNYQSYSSKIADEELSSEKESFSVKNLNPFSGKKKNKDDKEIELNLLYSGIKVLNRIKDDLYAFEGHPLPKPKPLNDRTISSSEVKRKNYQKEFKPSFYQKLVNLILPNQKKDTGLLSENIIFLQKESVLFFEQGLSMAKEIDGMNQFDYSPFILPFAKSFEKELSYSLVHWVRKKFDILLPSYFYEYEPGKIAEISLGRNYSIDFNQRRNDLWVSPTLGGQLSGFKQTVSSFGNHPFNSEEDYQEFLTIAYQIKNIRNRACHSERTTKQELEKIINCWKILFRKGYIKRLHSLKLEYMGQRTIA